MANTKKRRSNNKKRTFKQKVNHLAIGLLWRSALIVTVFAAIFYFAVQLGVFGRIPTEGDLKNMINYQASEVYAADGVLLGRYFVENRSESTIEEISPHIVEALIATEDSRFYEHKGVDQRSLLRVLFKTILLGQNTGGGSTISQQVAKNVFGRKNHGWLTMPVIKMREAIIANRLNSVYTKNEILELYLNTVSFGENTYGIKTACERFFSTTPKDIKLEEAAVLIGMLKAPTSYNPRLRPEKSKTRRNVVLSQMERMNYLTAEAAAIHQAKPLVLDYNRGLAHSFLAKHFRAQLRHVIQKWLEDNPGLDGKIYNLNTDGLKIHTTIDSRMQLYAEEAVNEHLKGLQITFDKDINNQNILADNSQLIFGAFKQTKQYELLKEKGWNDQKILEESKPSLDSIRKVKRKLEAGFLVTNPVNGHVLAWVGGRDFNESQYDHVKSKRQVGSIFKPIVYSKALVDGYTPCEFISNRRIVYTEYNDWSPQNSNNVYDGSYSLKGGLTHSVNTISVKLLMETGIKELISYARALGIKSELPEVPSLALGVANMSIEEVSSAYAIFANGGEKVNKQILTSIKTLEGEELYVQEIIRDKILSTQVSQDITQMMQSVADSGTAKRLRTWYGIEGDIAAKTGTTQKHADGWFAGFTPSWLGVVWVGADNPALHFTNIKDGQGANMALPIWSKFYGKLSRDKELKFLTNQKFSFEKDNCTLYKKDHIIMKVLKKKNKKNHSSGFTDETENENDTTSLENSKPKKKRFWDRFKKKKK